MVDTQKPDSQCRSLAIRLCEIEHSYPGTKFNLAVPQLSILVGECVALVGPSGCGKTTLLEMIAGLVLPKRGEVRVSNTIVNRLTDSQRRAFRARNIGFVYQRFELFSHLTAAENILLPAELIGEREQGQLRLDCDRLLEETGLTAAAGRRINQLSRGEQQRVAVCRALLTQPPVILADEPTGNLDPSNKLAALEILLKGAASRGATVLVATHDESLLARFDRVLRFGASGTLA